MKFCSFVHRRQPRFGVELEPGFLIDLTEAGRQLLLSGGIPDKFDKELLLGCPDLKHWFGIGRQALDFAEAVRDSIPDKSFGGVYAQNQTRLLPPIGNPGKIICVGLNYRLHAEEQGAPIPESPILFAKFPTAVIGPDEPIKLPAASQQVDAEAELCAVVLTTCRNASRDEAAKALAFTVGNDVSARDLQFSDKQWVRGKSCDTFAPLGPWVVTVDEIGDPHNLAIECRWNGKVMQSSNTSDLIFDCFSLVEFITSTATLEPGDIIFTGTPSGVGIFHDPPVFLQPGDLVEVSIDRLGILRNPVVAG